MIVILTLSGAEGEEPLHFAFAFAVACSLTLSITCSRMKTDPIDLFAVVCF